jgi:hypothetical protein
MHAVEEHILDMGVIRDTMMVVVSETIADQGAFCNTELDEASYPAISVDQNGDEVLKFGLSTECLSSDQESSVSVFGTAKLNITDKGFSVSEITFDHVQSEGQGIKEFNEQSLIQKLGGMNEIANFKVYANNFFMSEEFVTEFQSLMTTTSPATEDNFINHFLHHEAQAWTTATERCQTDLKKGTLRSCTTYSCPGVCSKLQARYSTYGTCCNYAMPSSCSQVGGDHEVESVLGTACKCTGEKNRGLTCRIEQDVCEYINPTTHGHPMYETAAAHMPCCLNYCFNPPAEDIAADLNNAAGGGSSSASVSLLLVCVSLFLSRW